nr:MULTISPECIES: GGDEF domain-containing protein [unclassified Legionella]
MFGGLLRQRLRRDDVVARYGGDEFIVLMENTSMDEAKKIAENLITEAKKSLKEGTLSELNLDYSIGITQMNHHSASVNTVIKEADLACYAAKQRKINGSVCVYNSMITTKNNAINFSGNQITP